MDPEIMQAVTGTPWATVVFVIGLIALAVSKFPGIAGDAGKAWTTWLEQQRRAAEIRDDADITDLKRQVSNLASETERLRTAMNDLRSEMRRRDAVLHNHYPWDVAAYQMVLSLGGKIDPPPSLWPDVQVSATPTTPTEGEKT